MKIHKSEILSLDDLIVLEFKIEENTSGNPKFNIDADFTPVTRQGNNKEQKGFIFELSINAKTKNPALKAYLKAVFLFSTDEGLPPGRQLRYVLYNGLSIAYGTARGMIFQACSALHPKLRILPSVDLNLLIDKKLDKMVKERVKKNDQEPSR